MTIAKAQSDNRHATELIRNIRYFASGFGSFAVFSFAVLGAGVFGAPFADLSVSRRGIPIFGMPVFGAGLCEGALASMTGGEASAGGWPKLT